MKLIIKETLEKLQKEGLGTSSLENVTYEIRKAMQRKELGDTEDWPIMVAEDHSFRVNLLTGSIRFRLETSYSNQIIDSEWRDKFLRMYQLIQEANEKLEKVEK